MNKHLQNLLNFLQQDDRLSAEEKTAALKSLKDADKELEIANFKLDRTEKVKRTTAILLEETIQELEQKRKAVEAQNRELEVEGALERIRAVAMSMGKPEDLLSISETMFSELKKLGFSDLRNAMINIHYDEQKYLLNYDFAENTGRTVTTFVYNSHPIVDNIIQHANQSRDSFTEMIYSGKALDELRAFRKKNGEADDARLDSINALCYYFYSTGTGAVGISMFSTANLEQLNILKRFRNVFDLAYRRYIDIVNAEAQMRESQIQLALERVRARTMAMQKSDELSETAVLLFHQLMSLELNVKGCGFNIWEKDERTCTSWMSGPDGELSPPFILPLTGDPLFIRYYESRLQAEDFWVYETNKEELTNRYKYLSTLPVLGDTITKELEAGKEIPAFVVDHVVNFSQGNLIFITYERCPDAWDIFKRFGKIFEQTYTRFLDLQKAEAQTKESQIQLALERVRARTMAMQHSDELADASFLLDSQVRSLGIKTWGCAFNIYGDNESSEWFSSAEGTLPTYITPREHIFRRYYEAGQRGEKILVQEFEGEKCAAHYEYLCTIPVMGDALRGMIAAGGSFPTRQVDHVVYFKYGYLLFISLEPVPDAHNIFIRFAKVFEQTYTRFLDLQKAEAQAREAKIEAVLEKIRSRSLAMHHSDELREVIGMVYMMLSELKVKHDTVAIQVFDFDTNSSVLWPRNTLQHVAPKVVLPYDENIMKENTCHRDLWEAMATGKSIINKVYSKQEKDQWFEYIFAHNDYNVVEEHSRQFLLQLENYMVCFFPEKYSGLYAESWDGTKYSEDDIDVLKKAARVFEQAYVRFIDLQKAEAQAREAKIEAALERVRSRSMAMHKSEELKEVIQVVYEQFVHLNIHTEHTGFVMDYKKRDDYNIWIADQFGTPSQVTIPYFDAIYYNRFNEAKATGKDFFTTTLSLEEKNKFYSDLFKHIPGFPEESKSIILSHPGFTISTALLENVALYIENFTGIAYSDEENNTLMRFGKVFQQTYTRFLDLQKAEAQTKESQVQLAMERVRARTMAMQHSNELPDAANILFQQVQSLGMPAWSAGYCIWDDNKQAITLWMSSAGIVQQPFRAPVTEDPSFIHFYEAYQRGETFYVEEIGGEELVSHYKYMCRLPVVGDMLNKFIEEGGSLPAFQIFHLAFFSQGFLLFITYEPVPEAHDIFKRFGNVFEQTYTRFLDLKKAEAQARESQIEAAMEKVRSRALAMQKPDELTEVAQVLRKEMNVLGVEELETSSIYIHHEETNKTECWYAIKDVEHAEKELVADHMTIDLAKTWVGRQMLEFYHSDKRKISIQMQGANRKEWINYCAEHSKLLVDFYGDTIPNRTYHLYKFSNGYMGAASPGDISQESWDLLQRATSVFSLAYTRFSDLQQAEAQAREAKIETALERVRSRTLAMQKSDELAETAAVLFQQLIALGIEPNRLYISIIKGDNGETEFWITDEDGTKVSTAFAANMNDNITFSKMYEGWKQQQKSLVIDMQGEELQNYFRHLSSLGVPFKAGLEQKRRVQDIAYFSKGFIGMASTEEQPAETLQLLERFAAVFNLTFTRFNDLKIAEAHAIQAEQDLIAIKDAKQKAEAALTELQSTQKQLIQSEKMASLGELTAGIAHEIQNPLNFVNNFSEVSSELIDEMKSELAIGNSQLAIEIADDIKQNLEKITHHGKRADGIVKGMLQHSQNSGNVKEPTDINALADEYLRLAYHGLRAKDKLFNATIKTDFDKSIGTINIIPQDIGRVILNIVTNAFYAVNEKKKSPHPLKGGIEYEPTVTVSTQKNGDTITVSVKDNGNGIPQNIIDKIFQPFFTTKPTGQGTGLGLSLAYDIVKAHGGELKAETVEGQSTTFFILLKQQA